MALSRKTRTLLVLVATALASVSAVADQSVLAHAIEAGVLTALGALGIVPLHLDVVDD
jgi:hypothetical protein